MNNIVFTGNVDTDKQILYLLDDFDLYKLYYTNKYIRKIILFNNGLQQRFLQFKKNIIEFKQNIENFRDDNGQIRVEIENHRQYFTNITREDILSIIPQAKHIHIHRNIIIYHIDPEYVLKSMEYLIKILGYPFYFEGIKYNYQSQNIFYIFINMLL